MSDTDPSELASQIASLQAENEQLRERVEQLENHLSDLTEDPTEQSTSLSSQIEDTAKSKQPTTSSEQAHEKSPKEDDQTASDGDSPESGGGITRRAALGLMTALGVGTFVASDPAAAASGSHLGDSWKGDPSANHGLSVNPTGSQHYGIFVRNDGDGDYGLFAVNGTPGGQGIMGRQTATSGVTKGLEGRVSSPDGIGLLGYNDATSGFAKGLEGRTDSTGAGKAVYGHARATSGSPRGVEGQTDSPDGIGVLGFASASSGTPTAVEGRVQSSSGYGLYTPDDAKIDGLLEASTIDVTDGSQDTSAIEGTATATSSATKGLKGQVSSPDGIGVLGYNDAASDNLDIGVEGRIDGTGIGKAVYGHAQATSGSARGVEGQTDSPDGIGVLGFASASSGTPTAVEGRVQSSSGYGLYTPDDAKMDGNLEIGGDLQATGTKNFVQTVSTDAGAKQVTYTAIEAGKARTEISGISYMTDGNTTIGLPDHFGLVTNDEKPLTVQVTPHADEKVHPQVTDHSINRIVVKDFSDGRDEYSFAYTIKGIREGFEDQEIINDA